MFGGDGMWLKNRKTGGWFEIEDWMEKDPFPKLDNDYNWLNEEQLQRAKHQWKRHGKVWINNSEEYRTVDNYMNNLPNRQMGKAMTFQTLGNYSYVIINIDKGVYKVVGRSPLDAVTIDDIADIAVEEMWGEIYEKK